MKRLTLFLTFALFLAPSLAAASDAEHAEARRLNEEGKAAFEAGDYVHAIDAFGGAYRADGDAKHLWNLALTEYKAGRNYDALRHLREYTTKPDASATNINRAMTIIAELTPKVARAVIVAPEGAEVLVDDARVGVAPLPSPIELDPAIPHVIVARRANDAARKALNAPGPLEVRVELSFPVAPTPPPSPPISATSHDAESVLSNSDHPAKLRTWATVGFGAAAIGFGAAAVYMASRTYADADDAASARSRLAPGACSNASTPGCADLRDALSSQDTHHTLSIVFYGAAGAFAAGALASWLLLPHDGGPPRKGAGLVPMASPESIGAAYVGKF